MIKRAIVTLVSFLFPLYFLGAAALAIPILLHLRRRPPKEHMEFSSLMFLEKSPERLTRRTRVDRWILLALRCLALLLLALIFCRPYFKSTTLLGDTGTGTRTAIMIDQSASMQRDGLWDQAVKLANETIAKTGAGDSVSVSVFGENLESISRPENTVGWTGSARKDELGKMLADAKPGWAATDLGAAIAELADETSSESTEGKDTFAKREVIVISDFQDGAERDALAQYAWPEDVSVRVLAVTPDAPGNLTANLVAATISQDSENAGPVTRRVRISNSQDSEGDTYQLRWAGEKNGKVIEGILPQGASRVVSVPPRESESNDAVLEIMGDSHAFDNKVYIARTQPRLIRVLFVGEDPKRDDVGSAYFYLARAMNKTKAIDPSVDAISFEAAAADDGSLRAANVIVLQLSEKTPLLVAKAVGEFVEDGGMVIALTGEGTSSETVSTLTGRAGLKLSEGEVSNYAMLSALDFEHPVLVPFARAKVRDFTKVRTWKHRSLVLPEEDDGVTRLADFDNGDPAWVEMNRGEAGGKLFVFTSGWEPQESQLALSSKFVPLIYAMLGQAGFSATEAKPLYVGDPISLVGITDAKSVKLPTGDTISLEGNATVFAETNQPGFYTVSTSIVGEERVFAVNLSPAESRIDPVDPVVALGDLGVNVETEAGEDPVIAGASKEELRKQQQRLEAEEKEGSQKIWKWIVIAIMIVLLIETWWAGRRKRSGAGTAASMPGGAAAGA